MPEHTIAYIDQAFEQESFEHDPYAEADYDCFAGEDALAISTWIENLKGLKSTAAARLSNRREHVFFSSRPIAISSRPNF